MRVCCRNLHLNSVWATITAPKAALCFPSRPLQIKQSHWDAALCFQKNSVSRKNNNLRKSQPSRKQPWQNLPWSPLGTLLHWQLQDFSLFHRTRPRHHNRALLQGHRNCLAITHMKSSCKSQEHIDPQLCIERYGPRTTREGWMIRCSTARAPGEQFAPKHLTNRKGRGIFIWLNLPGLFLPATKVCSQFLYYVSLKGSGRICWKL